MSWSGWKYVNIDALILTRLYFLLDINYEFGWIYRNIFGIKVFQTKLNDF